MTAGSKPALIWGLSRPCGAAGIAFGFRDLTAMSASEYMAEGRTRERGIFNASDLSCCTATERSLGAYVMLPCNKLPVRIPASTLGWFGPRSSATIDGHTETFFSPA